MDEQELKEFLRVMSELRAANTVSREKARQFLKDEGFLDENGEIAKQYAPDADSTLSA